MTITLDSLLPASFQTGTGSKGTGFDGVAAIWGERTSWNQGARYLVAAPSGSGKTSLSAFLSGRRFDYTGSITCDTHNLRGFTQKRWAWFRTTVMSQVFQDLRLIPSLSARENIDIVRAAVPNAHRTAESAEVREWTDELEIGTVLSRKTAQLSRGEQQRVAIVRSLISHTPFILLDEAFSHLDGERGRRASALIDRVARQRGSAIIHLNIERDALFEYDEVYTL